MDRALKERLIGAAALVAIVVLVVPVFLDGPSDETAVVSESLALPGQNEQARKRQTIVLERDREQPVPVPAGSRSAPAIDDAPEPDRGASADDGARDSSRVEPVVSPETAAPAATMTKPAPVEQPPAQAAPVEEKPEPPGETESATGMWAVQLGSFSSQENAERLAAKLRKSGFAAFLSQHRGANGALHRVRVGPQKDRASAEEVARSLGGNGHKGQVVPHP